eukprot:4310547-Pyramimonas_sp.AAC.1
MTGHIAGFFGRNLLAVTVALRGALASAVAQEDGELGTRGSPLEPEWVQAWMRVLRDGRSQPLRPRVNADEPG